GMVEGDGEDGARGHAARDQPAEALGRGGGLTSARPGRDEERTFGTGMRRSRLLGTQRPRLGGDHSCGAPPKGQMAACGQDPKRVMHVPGRSERGAGSKRPALMREMRTITTARLRSPPTASRTAS